MKNFLLFCLLSYPIFSFSQKDVQELKDEKAIIELKIEELKDSLNLLNKKITKFETDSILEKVDIEIHTTTIREKQYLKKEPDINSDISARFEGKNDVLITGISEVDPDYFKACINGKCGYLYYMFIRDTQETEKLREIAQNRKKEIENEKNRSILKEKIAQQKEIDQKMLAKYGKTVFDKMKKGLMWIGMNKEQLLFSWGDPERTNRTVGNFGTHEQWIYHNTYVYLENGIVTSYQD